jgi:hypothetical protein
MVGLCYDTPSVEAMPFIAIPDKTPYTVLYDFYQEKLPYKPPLGQFMQNIFSL